MSNVTAPLVGKGISLGMGTWKKKIIEKKSKGRHETGRSKGIVASALEKYLCKRNRSWKHPLYGMVMAKIGIRAKKK